MKQRCGDFIFSINGADLLGTFSQQFLFISLSSSGQTSTSEDIKKLMSVDINAAKRLVLNRYVWLHERRHFHDAFGTAAGLAAFRLNFECICEFAQMKKELGALLPPPPLWREDSPDRIKQFIRKYTLSNKCLALICGSQRSILSLNSVEDWDKPLVELQSSNPLPIHSELNLSPSTLICFPQAIGVRIKGKEVKATRYIPIDFTTLTEANSQMLQRELAYFEFGQEMRAAIVGGSWSVPLTEDFAKIMESAPLPYDTIDYVLARAARAGGANATIDPNTIFRVTEAALNRTKVSRYGDQVGVVFDTPSQSLATLLDKELTPKQLNGPAIKIENMIRKSIFDDLLVYIDSLPKWTDIPEDSSLESPICILYSYVMQEIAKPLLCKKLNPDFMNRYTTAAGYVELTSELPEPFIVATPNGFDVRCEPQHKQRLLNAWLKYCFVVDLVSQSVNGDSEIYCPRKHGFLKKYPMMNLCSGSLTCQQRIDRSLCGEWSSTQRHKAPICVFTNSLNGLGFISQKLDSTENPMGFEVTF